MSDSEPSEPRPGGQRSRAGLAGLALAAGWAIAEGIAHLGASTPWWSIFIEYGVLAPLAFALSISFVALSIGWGRWLRSTRLVDLAHHAWRWTTGGTFDERADRTAWLASLVVALFLWASAGLPLGVAILGTVRTPAFAVALLMLVLALLAIVCGLALGPVAALSRWLAEPLRRHRLSKAVIRPATLLLLGAAAAVVALIAAVVLFGETVEALPLWIGAAVASALGALGVVLLALRYVRRPHRAFAAALAVTIAAGLFAVQLPDSMRPTRTVFAGKPTVAGQVHALAVAMWDHDGDGALDLYAGGDCAPHDASIGPQAVEIIGNGIDEDCSGEDLRIDDEISGEGERVVELPADVNRRPHVFLITEDALSHSHTTVGRYERNTTPNLADWASRATVFEDAFSLSAATRTALPGLLAARFNSQMNLRKARSHPYPYARDTGTLAALLKKRGYHTIHVVGAKYFLSGWHAVGFDELVDAYSDAKDKVHTAPEVTRAVIEQIEQNKDEGPLFVWVHYYDTHHPYRIPDGEEPFGDGESDLDRFDTELRHVDRYWGELFSYIEETFKPDDYIAVFSADHGEAFDANHPRKHHSGSILSAPLDVPFIVQAPGRRGERIDGLVGHPDLLVTIANIVGIPPDDQWVGASLVDVLYGDADISRNVLYSLRYAPELAARGKDGFLDIGVRTSDRYLMYDIPGNDWRLVDWRNDLLERKDLSDRERDTYSKLKYLALKKLVWLRENERALVGD